MLNWVPGDSPGMKHVMVGKPYDPWLYANSEYI